MKIKLKVNLAIKGKHHAKGEIVEVSDRDGNYLVNRGRAENPDKKPQQKAEGSEPKTETKAKAAPAKK